MTHPAAKLFKKVHAKQKAPEHHSFSTRHATNFNFKPANATSTS